MVFDPNKITFFAETDARGKRIKFGIKAVDRARHMYVIGKTGMGKSTLLENMAIQDIQSGEGIAFIDPHGSTAEKLLDYIPEHRRKDVLYFAPFDTDYPVAFNVMEDVGADKRHLVVSGLMSTFKKIWVDAWSARMEYILSNTLLALLEYPGSTLLGVNRMLADKSYREAVVANVKDPSVKSFWVDEFAKYTERFAAEATPAIQNKIGQFTSNPLIRNIIGQPKSSFDIREMMDTQKIVIINLSKGLIGETNANLLGSMLITRIYLSAMSRADLSPSALSKMPNFYFYVDEFQSFANETFANILSEARKYKLNLTIAHQYIEQMEEEVRNAVFGNVGTTIAFRVGPFDAEVLETVFAPEFEATDLVNLGFAQVYMTLMIDGIGSRPFSAVTLPPIEPLTLSYKDMILAESRKQFGFARSEIEDKIKSWHEPLKKPEVKVEPKASSEPRVAVAHAPSVPRSEVRREPPRVEAPRPPAPKPAAVAQVQVSVAETPNARPIRVHDNAARASQVRRPDRPPFERKKTTPADLKNVLRSITIREHKPQPQVADAEKKQKDEAARNGLKAALDSVLKNALAADQKKEDREFVPEPKAPERVEVTQEAPPVRPEPVSAPKPQKDTADAHVMQKLERMLKTNGNEKPPIRRR